MDITSIIQEVGVYGDERSERADVELPQEQVRRGEQFNFVLLRH